VCDQGVTYVSVKLSQLLSVDGAIYRGGVKHCINALINYFNHALMH